AFLEGLAAVGGRVDVEPRAVQDDLDQLGHRKVVVHHEYRGHGRPSVQRWRGREGAIPILDADVRGNGARPTWTRAVHRDNLRSPAQPQAGTSASTSTPTDLPP